MPIYVSFSQDVIYLQQAQVDDINLMIRAMSYSDQSMLQHPAINNLAQLEIFHDSDSRELCQSLLATLKLQRPRVVNVGTLLV